VRETLKITDRAYIMHNGKILTSGTPQKVAPIAKLPEKSTWERNLISKVS